MQLTLGNCLPFSKMGRKDLTDGITLLDETKDREKLQNALEIQMRETYLAEVDQADNECKKKGGTYSQLPIPQTTTHECSDLMASGMTYTIRVSIKFI